MKRFWTVVVLLGASLTIVACGGGSSSSSTTGAEPNSSAGNQAAGGSTIHFEANPEGHLMFTTMAAKGKAGEDTIDFDNPSSTPHNVSIEDSAGKKLVETKTIAKSKTSVKVMLKPGTYTFFCSIPGHREGGMEGTLTIE